MTHKKLTLSICAILIILCAMLAAPPVARAQPAQQDDAVYYVGSFLFNIIRIPLKIVGCVSTQVATTAAYVGTYGVEGNYEGGTNGKQIGEVARGVCSGNWIIPAEQVKKDYE
jgi:hypothetical protein